MSNTIDIANNKTLKLTNVLACKIEINQPAAFQIAAEQMINYLKTHGAMPIGPLIQKAVYNVSEDGRLEVELYLMQQANSFLHKTESPFTMESVVRVRHCMYAHYVGPEEKLKFAYDKINVTAFEEDIDLATLKSINENIAQFEGEIQKLNIQKGSIENGQSEYQVFANTSGIVHMLNDFKEGMVVQAASAVGSIANENDQYIVTAYLSVNDRPRVSLGDDVNIEVVGLAQNTYGNLKGRLVSVDNDISTSQNGEQSFFKSKIEIETPYLISSKGNKVNISNGMSVEARIIYDELSYFDYLLESLGLLTRD